MSLYASCPEDLESQDLAMGTSSAFRSLCRLAGLDEPAEKDVPMATLSADLETERPEVAGQPDDAELISRYTNDEGMIVQCCHCRLTRHRVDRLTWEWVPAFIARQPENLSHGLCQTCFRGHYPMLAAKWEEYQTISDAKK